MMNYTLIDAHSHLWLKQDTVVDGLPIRTLENGRSLFMGEVRQMLPPFMVDGVNSAEIFLSNMDYAQVAAAVVTQEFIDGFQNDYLADVASRYPDRFFVCGMCEFRKPGYLEQARQLMARGFRGIKIPAQRLLLKEGRVMLNSEEMMQMFKLMEQNGVLLSIDLADGDTQVGEMEEVIQECPRLKVAIGHFGMGDPSRLDRAGEAGPPSERTHRVGRHHVALQRRVLSVPRGGAGHPRGGRPGRYGQADVGIGLSAHHHGHHLPHVL